LILDKLLSGDSNADLTKVQIQELLGLSKSFKSKSVQFDKIQTDLSAEQRRLDDEQKVINTDISRLSSELASTNMTIVEMKNNNAADASRNVEITALKKEIEDQRLSMWVAIGISIILGIIK
jgi:DNA helicase IV